MHYNFIIIGGGLSGLSMAIELAKSGKLANQNCLILEARDRYTQDKSWCGWHVFSHHFEDCTAKTWSKWQLSHGGETHVITANRLNYRYIPALSFYEHCLNFIKQHPNIDLHLSTPVLNLDVNQVSCENCVYSADRVFDARESQIDWRSLKDRDNYLLQCFYGWKVKTSNAVFDQDCVTLMDFPEQQSEGINFMYCLPLSQTEALLEPTYFLHHSKIPSRDHFLQLAENYMQKRYNCYDFEFSQEESGILPMVYKKNKSKNAIKHPIKIGTAGGLLRPSTGYAFYAIQRFIKKIAANIDNDPASYNLRKYSKLGLWMDQVFLRACRGNPAQAAQFFLRMFEKVEPDSVARFMHDEARWSDYLQVILAMPKIKFIKSSLRQGVRNRSF
tara:strand:+ start:129 stop:1289 length:1161 start_codon:yes stop_codon:yes gene_type:complete